MGGGSASAGPVQVSTGPHHWARGQLVFQQHQPVVSTLGQGGQNWEGRIVPGWEWDWGRPPLLDPMPCFRLGSLTWSGAGQPDIRPVPGKWPNGPTAWASAFLRGKATTVLLP